MVRATVILALAGSVATCAAFAPLPTCVPSLRSNLATVSTLRMGKYEDGKPKDLSKDNGVFAVALDSLRRLFSKSEDEYPLKEPALGFTMTPTTPKRNKGDWDGDSEESK